MPLLEEQIRDAAQARGMPEEQVARDMLLAAQPTKQFVTVEEVAALAAFLAYDGRHRSPARSFQSTAAGPRTERQGGYHGRRYQRDTAHPGQNDPSEGRGQQDACGRERAAQDGDAREAGRADRAGAARRRRARRLSGRGLSGPD